MGNAEYMKTYNQKPSRKKRHRQESAVRYESEEGRTYERQKARTLENRFSHAKHNATKRNKEWALTFDQYKEIAVNPCYYCNIIFTSTGSGLDRKNNDLGYVQGNIVSCCGSCNRRRSKSMDSEIFKQQNIENGRWKD